ncbi:MAG: TonB-dependent receptor [Candidatus Solibacter usitatus]|nr:TonB-dependent receptor [Candidatus Solibacter usitatus]
MHLTRLVLLFGFAVSFDTTAFAQGVAGMGGISGTVRDGSGAVIPGASVVVANESMGIRRTLQTTGAGVFAAPGLVPSQGYSVTVTSSGFAQWTVKDLEILVGQTVELRVGLQVSTSTTQVDVIAETPIVDESKTGVSQVIEKDQIDGLPINGRRADSFVLLSPAVIPDGDFGLVSFRGIAGGNAFLTDGNDTTGSFYNENAGRTRITTQISQDAVQEFQVMSDGFSAEFGRASGGVINTVTRSGSNGIHGTYYWFFRNRTLNATDRYAGGYNAPEVRHQTGGSLSGPIKKDKLFYFANFDLLRRNFPAINRIINNAFTDTSGNLNTPCAAPATQAQCDVARAFLTRQMNVVVPRSANHELGFLKIDWRPAERNTFSFSFNSLHWVSPNGIQTQAVLTTGAALGNNANSTVFTDYARASWTSIPTTSTTNELRLGWFKDRLGDPESSGLWPKETGPLSITLNGSNIGAASAYPRVRPSEQRYQFVDNFGWLHSTHSTRFGVDISTSSYYSKQLPNQFGTYSYTSFSNFAADLSGNATQGKRYSNFTQASGDPVLNLRTTDFHFYAQDTWKLRRRLTLNYGLRLEKVLVPQPVNTNPFYPQTGRINSPALSLAPRFSLAYALDEKTVLRAGYGIFHARLPGGALGVLFESNGVYQPSVLLQPATNGSPVFPNILSSAAGLPTGTVSLVFAAPDFRKPYTQQGTLAVERQFGRTVGVTASYIWSRGVHLFTTRDLNMGPLGPNVTYQILDSAGANVGSYTTATYRFANRVDSRFGRILQDENGGNSWYNGLAIQVRKKMSRGLTGTLSYTWSHAIDSANQGGGSNAIFFDSIRSTFNGDYSFDKGSSLLDVRHRAVVTFMYTPKFTTSNSTAARYFINGWTLSSLTTMASSRPATATVSVSGTPFTGAAYNSTLNGFGGSNRVPFYPWNSLLVDQIYRVDARITRQIPITERMKLHLNFEAFNAFNTISNTAILTQAFQASNGVLRPVAGLGAGSASQGFPDGTNARRMQASMRFLF